MIMVGTRRARAQRAVDAAAASAAHCDAELLVCDLTPEEPPLRLPGDLPATVLPMAGWTFGRARARAARAARGELVAYLEDHCYAERVWAAALCARADEGWSAIGYGFVNANPASRVSRAMALVEYGYWLVPARGSGSATMLAGNNIAYSRDALLALGDQADDLLDSDWVLQRVLRARGGRLLFEPAATAAHEHFERLAPALKILTVYGMVAAQRHSRSRGWSRRRRLLHVVLAVPLTAPLRIGRLLRARPDLAPRVARAAPMMILPLLATAVGEVRGAARPGGWEAAHRFARLEVELLRGAG